MKHQNHTKLKKAKKSPSPHAVRKTTRPGSLDTEEGFKALVEAAPVGVYLLQDGVVQYVNQKCASILGYKKEEAEGKLQLKDFVPPEDLPRAEETISKRMTGELSLTFYEGKFISKDKRLVDVEVHGAQIMHRGRPAVMGSLMDVTARKHNEQSLIESEEKFRILSDSAMIGIYLLQDRVFKYVNPVAAKMLGYSVEEIIGKIGPKDIFAPEDLPQAEQKLRQRLSGEKQESPTRFRAITKNRRDIYIEAYGTRIIYDGRPAVLGSVLDVTERWKAEQQIVQSEEMFKTLTEASLVGIYLIQDGKFKYVNPMFVRVSGYSAEELLNKILVEDFIYPEDWPMALENIRRRIDGEIKTLHYELRAIRKDRSIMNAELYSSRVIYNGRPAVLGTMLDITERKKAEQMQAKVFQLQKMEALGLLAGGVAHDLNNLLTVIQGYAELGLRRRELDKTMHFNMEEIVDAAQRGTALTQQLLMFGRKHPMQLMPLNLNTVIRELHDMFTRLINKNIIVKTDLEPDLCMVMADRVSMERIMINLMINAGDSMPDGGSISIKTNNIDINAIKNIDMSETGQGNYVSFSITDTGIGIDEETMQHVFEPFFTTKEQGTGLGLSVVHGIVKQHGGWINVRSKPGQGTTMCLYLPAVPEEHNKVSREPVALSDLPGKGERLLIVEDEAMIMDFIGIALGENGYKIFTASSAEDAIEIFKRERGNFDLVFSDVMLPGKSGIELVEYIASEKPGMKFLLTSGYIHQESNWSLIQERGYPFLQKPYALDVLFRTIREVLSDGKDRTE